MFKHFYFREFSSSFNQYWYDQWSLYNYARLHKGKQAPQRSCDHHQCCQQLFSRQLAKEAQLSGQSVQGVINMDFYRAISICNNKKRKGCTHICVFLYFILFNLFILGRKLCFCPNILTWLYNWLDSNIFTLITFTCVKVKTSRSKSNALHFWEDITILLFFSWGILWASVSMHW